MRSTDGRLLSLGRLAAALAGATVFLGMLLAAQIDILFSERPATEAPAGNQRTIDMPALNVSMAWPDASGVPGDGRSLFLSNALAEVQVAAPIEPPPPEQPQEQLSLVAVLIAPTGKFALLRSQQSQELRQVEEGADMAGWTLATVEANRVILEHRGQQTILYLPDTIPDSP